MFKVPLFLAMLCVGDIAHVGAEYMCGTELEPYDSNTQTCVDGKVVDNTMICGYPFKNIPIKRINLRTHDCVDGMEVSKTKAQTQATSPPPGSPGPPETTKPASPSQTTKSSPAPNLDRRHSTEMCHSDKVADGYACCVNKLYRPAEETCCIITNSYYEVLPGPEIDHICCTDPDTMTSTVHRRGSPNITCQHPSSNDQLFGRGQKLEALKKCDTFKHVFIIRFKNQNITKSSTTIDISIRGWTRRKQNNTVRHSTSKWSRTNQVKAQLDKFIPVNGKLILRDDRVIKKKCFLLFTNKNYYEDAVFFLDQNEVLYECPKKRQSKKQSKKQSKRQSKKQSKRQSKKKQSKRQSKKQSKRQSKRQSKKQTKRQSKRQSKKQSKRQSKRHPIKQLVQEYIKNCN